MYQIGDTWAHGIFSQLCACRCPLQSTGLTGFSVLLTISVIWLYVWDQFVVFCFNFLEEATGILPGNLSSFYTKHGVEAVWTFNLTALIKPDTYTAPFITLLRLSKDPKLCLCLIKNFFKISFKLLSLF